MLKTSKDQMAFKCTILVIAASLLLSVHGKLKPAECLTGEFHKASPGPETKEYKACLAYKDKTCCTAEFTKQLARSPVKIGNFSWNTCSKPLSPKCEAYMKEVECFYQCSPNVGYFKGAYKGSFTGVPVCSTFCNAWFDACKSDQTCAKNWITGFDLNAYKENKCKPTSTCKTFSEVYGNAEGLCQEMWGASFKYVKSKVKHDCMHLNASDPLGISTNYKVAEKLNKVHSSGIWTGPTYLHLAVLFSLFGLIFL